MHRLALVTSPDKGGVKPRRPWNRTVLWRIWDNVTEESNRDDTRAGVTNLFTLKTVTATVGMTKSRLYRGRPHRYNVIYVTEWVSGCRPERCSEWRRVWTSDDSSAHRVRTTPWSIGWELRRTRYGEPEFTGWINSSDGCQPGMSLQWSNDTNHAAHEARHGDKDRKYVTRVTRRDWTVAASSIVGQ